MEKVILIVSGFVVGLSLGAILSWRDNDYKGVSGVLWSIYFSIGIGLSVTGLIIF